MGKNDAILRNTLIARIQPIRWTSCATLRWNTDILGQPWNRTDVSGRDRRYGRSQVYFAASRRETFSQQQIRHYEASQIPTALRLRQAERL